MNEIDLTEDRTARERLYDRTDVLDRVKELAQLPDGEYSTTAQVAAFYAVPVQAIYSHVHDHRAELEGNGYRTLRGSDLRELRMTSPKEVIPRGSAVALWTRRAILNLGMLLRNSEVAKEVRTYLLDAEDYTRKAVGAGGDSSGQSTASPVMSVDALIAEISGRMAAQIVQKSVVPELSALEERVRLLEVGAREPVSNQPAKKRRSTFNPTRIAPVERVVEYIEWVTQRGDRHCFASLDTYAKNVRLAPDAVEDALIQAVELGFVQQVGSTKNGHPVMQYFRRGR